MTAFASSLCSKPSLQNEHLMSFCSISARFQVDCTGKASKHVDLNHGTMFMRQNQHDKLVCLSVRQIVKIIRRSHRIARVLAEGLSWAIFFHKYARISVARFCWTTIDLWHFRIVFARKARSESPCGASLMCRTYRSEDRRYQTVTYHEKIIFFLVNRAKTSAVCWREIKVDLTSQPRI